VPLRDLCQAGKEGIGFAFLRKIIYGGQRQAQMGIDQFFSARYLRQVQGSIHHGIETSYVCHQAGRIESFGEQVEGLDHILVVTPAGAGDMRGGIMDIVKVQAGRECGIGRTGEEVQATVTSQERVALFAEAVADIPNVSVVAYQGLTVDFARKIGAKVMVRGLRAITDFEYEFQIALTNKPLAPEVEFAALMTSQQHTFLSASILKEVALLGGDTSTMCPPHVTKAMLRVARQRGYLGSGKIDRI